jgi:hypothetical protein
MDRGRERERERGRGRERNRGYVCACLYQMTKILVSRQSGIREDHQASRKPQIIRFFVKLLQRKI